MIILDTNILSEMMKPSPSENVLSWLNQQITSNLFLTSISCGEIEFGLQILPNSDRKKKLKSRFDEFISRAFKSRILAYDSNSAELYGIIMANRRNLGRPMSIADGQTAAISRMNSFDLATRNIKDFKECGIDLINPFD